MKNNILKFTMYLYYLSLAVLLIIYFFPGSLIGYLLYGDLNRQLILFDSQISGLINHFLYFFYLSFLGVFFNLRKKKFIGSFLFLFIVCILLEFFHFFIPNRAFELNDILANSAGVTTVFFLSKLMRRFNL